MKVLVIYDSFFGNTEQIAQAIGDNLGSAEDVKIVRVSEVKPEQISGLEFLIVGSPTRAFRATPAITNLIKGISKNGLKGIKVSAFDTRISINDINSSIGRFFINLFGYAAKPMSDIPYPGGPHINYCPQSGGLWFNAGELQSLLAQERNIRLTFDRKTTARQTAKSPSGRRTDSRGPATGGARWRPRRAIADPVRGGP